MTNWVCCVLCERSVPEEDLTRVGADDLQGLDTEEWLVCSTCLVSGIASGDVDVNPNALIPQDDDIEGEEWKL